MSIIYNMKVKLANHVWTAHNCSLNNLYFWIVKQYFNLCSNNFISRISIYRWTYMYTGKIVATYSMLTSQQYNLYTKMFYYILYNNVTSVCIFIGFLLWSITHTDGVKSTPYHVSGLVFLFSCPKILQ